MDQNCPNFNTNQYYEYNIPFSMEELEYSLGQCKSSAPGIDQIIYEFIKYLPIIQKSHLIQIYNNIWENRTYPRQWKEATIIPIPKLEKNPENPSNYRPISLTSCMSKLLEKMVSVRLMW